jgi:hypothetical protein
MIEHEAYVVVPARAVKDWLDALGAFPRWSLSGFAVASREP